VYHYRKRLCDIHSNDLTKDSLSAYDAFLLDDSRDHVNPTVYVWLRRGASQNGRQIPPQYAELSPLQEQRTTQDVSDHTNNYAISVRSSRFDQQNGRGGKIQIRGTRGF